MTTARVLTAVLVWLAVAALLAALGIFAELKPPAPQAMILALSLIAWLATRRVAPLRAWSDAIDPRVLVAPHLVRAAAGARFLQLSSRGELPSGFAVPAAWGDIAVAVVAAMLLCAGAIRSRDHARAWLVWNVLGLVDILLVIVNAARFWTADPGSMAPMLRLPLALLPSFLVPIILVTHALFFSRLAAIARSARR
jgi:hypothetical protein